MPNFCKKCGSQLYDTNDCPVCGTQQTSPQEEPAPAPQPTTPVSIHPKTDAQKKKLKKKIIHAKNKAKKNVDRTMKLKYMSIFQKTTRIAVKCISLLLVCVIALSLIVGALTYYGKLDVPFVTKALTSVGIKNDKNESEDKEDEPKKPEPEVTDSVSALKKAQEFAIESGYPIAAENLTFVQLYNEDSTTCYEFQQTHNNIPVYDRTVIICVDEDGQIAGKTLYLAEIDTEIVEPQLYYEYAQICIREDLSYNQPDFIYSIEPSDVNIKEYTSNQLVYFIDEDDDAHLSYKLEVNVVSETYIYVLDALEGIIYDQKRVLPDDENTIENLPTEPESDVPTDKPPHIASGTHDRSSTPTTVEPMVSKKPKTPDFTYILLIVGGVLILIAIVLIILKTKKKSSSASKYPKTF